MPPQRKRSLISGELGRKEFVIQIDQERNRHDHHVDNYNNNNLHRSCPQNSFSTFTSVAKSWNLSLPWWDVTIGSSPKAPDQKWVQDLVEVRSENNVTLICGEKDENGRVASSRFCFWGSFFLSFLCSSSFDVFECGGGFLGPVLSLRFWFALVFFCFYGWKLLCFEVVSWSFCRSCLGCSA